MNIPKCFLDDNEAVDGFKAETGNNAEVSVIVNLCEDHFREWDNNPTLFESEYAPQIMGLSQETA